MAPSCLKWPFSSTNLQVSDVSVDVHGGRYAVLRDVLVVGRAWLTVHSVDTGDGDTLVSTSNVSAQERQAVTLAVARSTLSSGYGKVPTTGL